jgi:hypothetical protein
VDGSSRPNGFSTIRPPGVHQERRVPHGKEADWGGRVGVREWRAWQIDEFGAGFVSEAPHAHVLEHRRDLLERQPGPVGDVVCGRGPEAVQVATHQVLARRVGAHVRRADPVVRRRVEISTPALPRTGRRRAHEVEPHADAVDTDRATADDRLDVSSAQHSVAQPALQALRGFSHLACRRSAFVRLQPPLPPGVPDGERERPVVTGGDEVDRLAHERSLHDRLSFERPIEVVALEAREPRPQADVHRWRILRLEPAHPLEHSGNRRLLSPEKQLSREQRSIQLAPGERSLCCRHGDKLFAVLGRHRDKVPGTRRWPPV